MEPHKRAFSIAEFGAAFGIGRTLVYSEIRDGRLKILKVGRRTLITIEAADEWRRRLEKTKSGLEAESDG